MDQNFQAYQSQPSYQPAPVEKNAAYYRAKAREKLRPCYWYALGAYLLASLLGGISSGGFSFSFSNTDFSADTEVNVPLQNFAEALRSGDFSAIWGELPPWAGLLLGIGITAAVFGVAFSIFVGSPMKLGYQRYNLNVMDDKGKDLSVMFAYFKNGYGKSIALNLLYSLITFVISLPLLAVMLVLFVPAALDVVALGNDVTEKEILAMLLWAFVFFAVAILTVIVEILVTYRYTYCYTVLAEYPEMNVIDAFRNSAMLMKGNKWRLFCLQFSFIGWILLAACCTCGIGAVFLSPYMMTATTAFYDDIANRQAAREAEFPSLDPNDYTVE